MRSGDATLASGGLETGRHRVLQRLLCLILLVQFSEDEARPEVCAANLPAHVLVVRVLGGELLVEPEPHPEMLNGQALADPQIALRLLQVDLVEGPEGPGEVVVRELE